MRLIIKMNSNGQNNIEATKTWEVSFLRHGAGRIAWTVDIVNSLDGSTTKLLSRYGIIQSKSDTDELYVAIKSVGSGLIGCKFHVSAEENNKAWEVKKMPPNRYD